MFLRKPHPCLVALLVPVLIPLAVNATTIGGAMVNASADGRPIVWKNRDGGEPIGSKRHFLSFVTGRTYLYLGVHPSDLDPRMGLNEVGIGFGNCTASEFTSSPNYRYSNTQAMKQYVLGETTNLDEVRQSIIGNTVGDADDWPTSVALMPGIFDSNGKVVLWEIGDNEYYEYNPENPNRLAQNPWQIYARDNTVHTRTDHTDDWSYTGSRYVLPRNLLLQGAANGGNTITDMVRIAREGEAGFQGSVPSRSSTSTTMIAHGVLPGEDPRIATMWNALGQPDYASFVPVWVAIGNDLSPRVATNDLHASLSGASEKLWLKREAGDYDKYINSLLEPMEANFIEIVEAARTHWFQVGFDPEEARRIHQEASETAWRTMETMAGGSGRNLNVTPQLTALSASVSNLTVSFGATAGDPDGVIAAYDWNFGDGSTSTSPAPVHTYTQEGIYLVRSRVTDNAGSRNSKWIYLTLGPVSTVPLVTITTVDPTASELGSDTGAFAVTRTGPTDSPLTVSIVVSGTATPGEDYQTIGTSATIPAGSSTATIVVTPLNDTVPEESETVTMTLSSGTGYTVDTPANATVSIADDETLFQKGDTWRYFKGTTFPGPAWNELQLDDSAWLTGPTGIGYGDADDNTVLSDMPNNYVTVYMRKVFAVGDATTVAGLTFTVDYDDGFVAFINGIEVARRGVAGGQNESTTATNHEAGVAETIDLSPFVGILQTGTNLFAIEVHNQALDSSDLSMIPALQMMGGTGPAIPDVTITASDAAASELGTDTGAFTVSRTGSTTDDLTVTFAVSGNATEGADYQPIGTSVTVPAGSPTATITVTPIDDAAVEGSEDVTLALVPGTAYNLGPPASATVSIADDETPTVTISATDPNASEAGPDTGLLMVTRSGSTTSDLTVTLAVSGSATEGSDYQGIGLSLTIPAGSATASITVTPIDDASPEGSEEVTVTLSPGTGYSLGTPASATVVIADDDPAVGPVTVFQEGDVWSYFKGTSFPGSTWNSLGFDDSVWLTGPTGIGYGDGDDSTVLSDMRRGYLAVYVCRDFTVSDASSVTALSFIVDYDDGFVAFINGIEVARRGVAVGQDQNTEATNHEAGSPESIDLSPFISSLQTGNNVFAIEVHNSRIQDSDLSMIPELQMISWGGPVTPTVTLSATDPNASEPGTDTGLVTATRTGSTTSDLTVTFAVSGTATQGADYVSIGTSVTIPAGSATATITVTPMDDSAVEGSEEVTVTLSPGTGYDVGTPSIATVVIADDEVPPGPVTVFQEGDTWSYFKGTSFPGSTWNVPEFVDSAWLTGPTGIGYGDGDDSTVLSDMRRGYLTVYMRGDFTVSDASSVTALSFVVDYDDGFVAFINGIEVARRGVAAGQDQSTKATRHEAGRAETIDLSPFISSLQNGTNVFAIEVHNSRIQDSDLSMIPTLQISQ